jgi:hypothetical protein
MRYDGFLSFEAGVNTYPAPVLLPKNQLGGAINASMRGTFIVPRPGYRQILLSMPLPQASFQRGCYYKPDSGLESLVVQIGGRLFEIIPSPTDNTASVAEITIPGDPNPAQDSIAWLWASERWVVVNDGVSVPVVYDRLSTPTTRRTNQFQEALYTLAEPFTAPGQGNTVKAHLSAAYTQGANYPVCISADTVTSLDASPQTDLYTVAPENGAVLTLNNQTGTPGKVIKGGTNIYTNAGFLGFVIYSAVTGTEELPANKFSEGGTVTFAQITLSTSYPPLPGATETTVIAESDDPNYPIYPAVGSQYPLNYQFTSRNTVVATTLNSSVGTFTIPLKSQTVQVAIQGTFNGVVGSNVFIGGAIFVVTAINNNPSDYVILTQTSASPTAASNTVVVAGSNVVPVSGGAELPPARMGCYGMGQNWFSLPDGRSFACGDIVGSASGTPAYNYRDSVLKMTENTYLANGGNFAVPGNIGSIQAMAFVANLDQSLGQGPLQVATEDVVFSCQSQITLEASGGTWASVTNPILTESLIANGSVSQDSSCVANGDLMFRAPDGYRSLILGRRDFNTWGNVPISVEVIQYIQNDNPALLQYSSAIVFDNRYLGTCSPTQGTYGVYHTGLVALNFDPISGLHGKQPSIWEGQWTGLNVLQLLTGRFSGVPRAFAFNYNTVSNTIELWEILPSTATPTTPVTTLLEFPVMAFGEIDPRKREWKKLEDGELAFDQITSPVTVQSWYRPDYDSRWQPWNTFTIPAAPNYQPRCGLDKPPKSYDVPSAEGGTGRFFPFGFHFQVRLAITGTTWRLMAGRFMASIQPQAQFPPMLPKTPPS